MSATITASAEQESERPTALPPVPGTLRPDEESAVVSMLTLVIWVGCLSVGIVGLLLPYTRPHAPAAPPLPVTAELLNVELTSEPVPMASPAPRPPNLMQPPPAVPPQVIPPVPPMMSVAAPSPQIAFAMPVPAPARIVPIKDASYRTAETPPVEPALPEAQPLTFGQGEGKQPAPEYPRQALREGQEGVVTVRMNVGEDGRVLAVEASSPSSWPLLNQAALRVVKSRWRFSPGKLRAYEVAIRFQVNR